MKIEVQTDQKFSTYDQFDPLKLKTIRFFHMDCGGGAVVVKDSPPCDSYFVCTACGDRKEANTVDSREVLRQFLIEGKPSASPNDDITFQRGEKNEAENLPRARIHTAIVADRRPPVTRPNG